MPTNAQLLRTKSDTATPDTDYVTTQALPATGVCYAMPYGAKHTGVLFTFRMNNAEGTRIANNTTTFTATPVLVDRINGVINQATAYTGTVLGAVEVRVPEGYEVTLQLSALTSPPATISTMQIYAAPMSAT